MPHYAIFSLSKKAAKISCLSQSEEQAKVSFLNDFSKDPNSSFTPWDEVKLNFELDNATPTVILSYQGKNIVASLPTELSNKLKANPLPTSLTVKELRTQYRALIAGPNESSTTPGYQQLYQFFIDHLLKFKIQHKAVNLIRYAGQHALFAYPGYFSTIVDNAKIAKIFTKPIEGESFRAICSSKQPHIYHLQSAVQLILDHPTELDEQGDEKQIPIAKVYLEARFDTDKNQLLDDPELIVEFPDSFTQPEIAQWLSVFKQNYATTRNIMLSDSHLDIGQLTLKKHANTLSNILLALGLALLIGTVICSTLLGLGVLPALPFLASSSIVLGSLSLNAGVLSALTLFAGGLSTGLLSLWGEHLSLSASQKLIHELIPPNVKVTSPTSTRSLSQAGTTVVTAHVPAAQAGARTDSANSAATNPRSPSPGSGLAQE